jgi:integrase
LLQHFLCAYHVGTRKGELRQTRWDQVDWDAGLIRLAGKQTKNGKPRTLPIYGDMRRWLEEQRAKCPVDNPYVFFGRLGNPVGRKLPGWAEACRAAGLGGLLFHDLRRSAVRNMKRAGVHEKVAMMISGHRTRSMFERYDIIDEDDMEIAGRKLEEYAAKRKQERAAKLKRIG